MASSSQPPNSDCMYYESLEEFHKQKARSIVCIMSRGVVQGGGCFVEIDSEPWILTATHVIHEKEHLRIVCVDKTKYRVSRKITSRENDLAVLKISKSKGQEENPDFPCLRLSDESPRVMSRGAPVHFIGHPGRFIYTHNMGDIAVARDLGEIYKMELGFKMTDTNYPTLDERKNVGLKLVDDFLGLSAQIPLLQVKNVHGGGRVGGTGAPFLDMDGNVVAIYSFNFNRSDYGVHVSCIKENLQACQEELLAKK